ncbi:hypothetical protein M8494_04705 [Serratia ureilytica]
MPPALVVLKGRKSLFRLLSCRPRVLQMQLHRQPALGGGNRRHWPRLRAAFAQVRQQLFQQRRRQVSVSEGATLLNNVEVGIALRQAQQRPHPTGGFVTAVGRQRVWSIASAVGCTHWRRL